jgi:hypothetical protein
MIVRFDLEHDVVLLVEANDSRIILEDAHAPIVVAQLATDLLGC